MLQVKALYFLVTACLVANPSCDWPRAHASLNDRNEMSGECPVSMASFRSAQPQEASEADVYHIVAADRFKCASPPSIVQILLASE